MFVHKYNLNKDSACEIKNCISNPVEQIVSLRPEEKQVIRRYQKHLWNIAKISLKQRDVLSRIIGECGQELDMIENDLKAG